MVTRIFLVLASVAAVMTLPVTALAHPGPHTHPHAEHAHHPLLTLDHVLPLLGIVAAVLLYRVYRARS